MKLRKVITTAGFIMASITPANAQLYMCQSCPAGSWSDGTFKNCKNCLTTGVTACNSITGKATSCKPGYGLSNGTCSACSSGYYSAGGTATSCTICPAGYYCPGGTDKEICPIQEIKNETCYQSAECYSAQTYSSAGAASCTLPTSIDKAIHELRGADETSGVLEANKPYLLVLGGGNGGDNKGYNFNYCNMRYGWVTTDFSGGFGGLGAYLIIPKKNISYYLGSGAKGTNSDELNAAAGGGGGSWMIFQNTSIGAIVAGGGGGAPSAMSNDVMGSQGGAGGAMGAGGGSGDWYGKAAGRAGGASGKLAGGNGGGDDHYGGTGKGHSLCETLGNYCGGLGGSVDRTADYTPVISDNTYGGTGGWSVKFKNKTNEMITLHNTYGDYCFTYDKYYAYRLPGNGSTGIIEGENFNEYVYIQKIPPEAFEASLCTSCAKLYSLK